MTLKRPARFGLRAIALGYLGLLLLLPVGLVFEKTFAQGLSSVWAALSTPAAISALWLTLEIAVIAVVANTVFGVVCALVIVRGRGRARWLLDLVIEVPFVISPVIVGLSLILVYGTTGWFGKWLVAHGIAVIFNPLGMILATVFVSLPFVVREVVPVLREVGTEQEEAAATLGASRLQTFLRITLPSIRWGLVYGIVLTTARALGEFGAVIVVSGNISGQTQTLPLLVDTRFYNFDSTGAYTAGALLAAISIFVLVIMTMTAPDRRRL
ncbi:MAG TPA: sulfate ABC transporter permease subunit [Solirubrobacteraceae bacterium]|jgi:sulfate transport system permease protein|nr:sulfate ABC transporter permease subunit [Solirubrobacteraceae bacterium]